MKHSVIQKTFVDPPPGMSQTMSFVLVITEIKAEGRHGSMGKTGK